MHSYLKSVGFSNLSKNELKEILEDVVNTYDEKLIVDTNPETLFAEFSKNYGCDCGITVCGEYDEKNQFHMEYYFPFSEVPELPHRNILWWRNMRKRIRMQEHVMI